MIGEKELLKLQNGSDIRGVAMEGVPDEPVTLPPAVANCIAGAFVRFLIDRTGKKPREVTVAERQGH